MAGWVAAPLLAVTGLALTLVVLVLLYESLPHRRNFAGHRIPAAAGIVFLPIILLTLLLFVGAAVPRNGLEVVGLAYVLMAGCVGFVDDLWGGTGSRGFRGHLGALLGGRITTGFLKVAALGGGGVVFGVVVFGPGWEALVAAYLLAGSANLANLFDVRPGRMLKFVGIPVLLLLLIAPLGAVLAVVGVVGGAAGLFYFDLKGRIMLGDAGAAVYGAVLGYLIVVGGPGVVWWVAGAVILGLTLVAEFSSISRVIQAVGALRWLDLWGRGTDE